LTDITGYFGNGHRECTGQPVATNCVGNNNVGVAAEDNIDAGGAVVDVDEGGEEGNGVPIVDNAQANDLDDAVSMNIINSL
jgi:hypothetical protein